MKKISVYILCFMVFSACNYSYKPEKPENLIAKDKMVDVLMDISLLSSAKGVNKKKLENKDIHPETYIYKKHHIDSLQFVESNAYYASNGKVYEEILNAVTDSLKRLKDKFDDQVEKEAKDKRFKDSIKREETKKKKLKEFKAVTRPDQK
ncbi:DUF4296 domain-containing protein [Mangrovimonas cancribranchiae]|uniref:DUF4296 domain-containing protein n=1 Tax=Mangrovimonas cancribranchiae TaxID=3080055 RepID=A0AAU6P2U5_9FLAO